MQPIKFPEANVVFGENQPEYKPLPALKFPTEEGIVITCWQLTDDEIEIIRKTKCLWLSQMTFNDPLQPIYPTVHRDELIIHQQQQTDNNELENAEKSE